MKNIKAILFDVDGVLLDSVAANAAFYRELFRRIGGVGPTDEEMLANNHLSIDGMLRRYYPEKSDEEIRKLATLGDVIDAGFELLKPMPGVAEIIPKLAVDFKLGLVTNRRVTGVEELWQVIPLQQYFSAIASFEKTDKHKPDPEPVFYALKVLAVKPENAVFVGDAKTDLQAGQAAGVEVIILGQENWPGATATIASIAKLPLVLSR